MSNSDNDDSANEPTQLTIARWSDRFFAWLIDYVIVWVGSFTVFSIAIGVPNLEPIMEGNFEYSFWFEFSILSLVFFAYWFILEYKTGQSIGKKAMRLKITNLRGKHADIKAVAISSFGKAFPYLLPIDVILGRIFTNEKRQRIFNRLGKTIVLKIEQTDDEPENIAYKKD